MECVDYTNPQATPRVFYWEELREELAGLPVCFGTVEDTESCRMSVAGQYLFI
jgi:hypothetical protein